MIYDAVIGYILIQIGAPAWTVYLMDALCVAKMGKACFRIEKKWTQRNET